MKELRFTSDSFASTQDLIPDTVLDQTDIEQLEAMTGVTSIKRDRKNFENLTGAATQSNNNARVMREQNIKPGTQDWFRLWFGNNR